MSNPKDPIPLDKILIDDTDTIAYVLKRSIAGALNPFVRSQHELYHRMCNVYYDDPTIYEIQFRYSSYNDYKDTVIIVHPASGTRFKDVVTQVCMYLENAGYEVVNCKDVSAYPGRREFLLQKDTETAIVAVAIDSGDKSCRVERTTVPIPDNEIVRERVTSFKIVCDPDTEVTGITVHTNSDNEEPL